MFIAGPFECSVWQFLNRFHLITPNCRDYGGNIAPPIALIVSSRVIRKRHPHHPPDSRHVPVRSGLLYILYICIVYGANAVKHGSII